MNSNSNLAHYMYMYCAMDHQAVHVQLHSTVNLFLLLHVMYSESTSTFNTRSSYM